MSSTPSAADLQPPDADLANKHGTKKAKKELHAPVITESEASNAEDSSDLPPSPRLPPNPDMTAEEKARANRDRNREHAKKTRLRKKAYLEQLKNTVENLQSEVAQVALENANKGEVRRQANPFCVAIGDMD